MTGATVKINLAPREREGVSQCQNSLDSDSDTSPDSATSKRVSESEKKLIRILLSQAASDALTATGEQAFAIVHRSMRGVEEPETAGRWVISLAPVSWETAQDACKVLTGELVARKPKKAATLPVTCVREERGGEG